MDRFRLKTYSVGYEIPFFDINEYEGKGNLGEALTKSYLDWFDLIHHSLEVIQLPNTNYMLVYVAVVKVDTDLVNPDTFMDEWTGMKSNIEGELENMLNSSNLEYRKLEELDGF